MFNTLVEEIVSAFTNSGRFGGCTVHNAFSGTSRPSPLTRPHIAVGLASADISACAADCNSAYNSTATRYYGDLTAAITVSVPAESNGITCLQIFSNICKCIFGECESILEPVNIKCGEVTTDRYSHCFVLEISVSFKALLNFA